MSHGLHFACSALTCYPGCPALALIEIQMTGNGKGWGWGWAPPMWFPKGFGKGGWGRRRGPRILGRPWPPKSSRYTTGRLGDAFPKRRKWSQRTLVDVFSRLFLILQISVLWCPSCLWHLRIDPEMKQLGISGHQLCCGISYYMQHTTIYRLIADRASGGVMGVELRAEDLDWKPARRLHMEGPPDFGEHCCRYSLGGGFPWQRRVERN